MSESICGILKPCCMNSMLIPQHLLLANDKNAASDKSWGEGVGGGGGGGGGVNPETRLTVPCMFHPGGQEYPICSQSGQCRVGCHGNRWRTTQWLPLCTLAVPVWTHAVRVYVCLYMHIICVCVCVCINEFVFSHEPNAITDATKTSCSLHTHIKVFYLHTYSIVYFVCKGFSYQ